VNDTQPTDAHQLARLAEMLIWYDRPVCFILRDNHAAPHLCSLVLEDGGTDTYTALPITEAQVDALKQRTTTHLRCWMTSRGPVWIIRDADGPAKTTLDLVSKKNIDPAWWPSETTMVQPA